MDEVKSNGMGKRVGTGSRRTISAIAVHRESNRCFVQSEIVVVVAVVASNQSIDLCKRNDCTLLHYKTV